jgi:hypothetical protein
LRAKRSLPANEISMRQAGNLNLESMLKIEIASAESASQ